MRHLIDMTARRFGSLLCISRSQSKSSSGDAKWVFLCDCGETTEATGFAVRSGKKHECATCAKKRAGGQSVTHGMTNSDEYGIWSGMITRCTNAKHTTWKNYGGRGVSVCDEWINSFEAFFADMGERPSKRHSIDRIDVNGNYSKENCRWADMETQSINKRNTVMLEIDGVTRPARDWAIDAGQKPTAVTARIRGGFSGRDALKSTRVPLTHNGITDSVTGWSRRTGIKQSTISMRISKYGWSVQDALTIGAKI